MSGLLGTPKIRASSPTLDSLRIQSSAYGLPVPIVYGTARVAGNLIHLVNAQAKLVTTTTHSGSKLVAVSNSTQSYVYSASVILALCEGPISGLGLVWREKDAAVDFTTGYIPYGWSVVLGTSSQSPWGYLTTNYPAQAVPYQYVAYVDCQDLNLPSDTLSNYSWEVLGFLPFGGPGAVIDANPSDILYDLLTDVNHGLGLNTAGIGSLASFYQYCAAFGLFMSPVYDSQQTAQTHIDRLLQIGNSAAVWSDGTLKVLPYGDTAATANGQTFTPNTTALYALGASDFLAAKGQDPVKVERAANATAYNTVPVQFTNRHAEAVRTYATEIVEAKDDGAIAQYGIIRMPTVTLDDIKDIAVAQQVAQITLQRAQAVRNVYTFKLPIRYSLLEPMDLVTLTDGTFLHAQPVRLTEVTELADGSGIQCKAEDFPAGVATAARYTVQGGTGYQPSTNVAPSNTEPPAIFEAPRALESDPLVIYVAAAGTSLTNWGGCDVYVSTDNATFTKVGSIIKRASYGVLTANLATGPVLPSVDNVHTLSVNLTASGGALTSWSATDFAKLTPLCYVGGEFMAYETAALTSAYHYNLTTLGRGALGTSKGGTAHSIGDPFIFIDGAIFALPWPKGNNGDTLYFKLPAFNVYGQQLQDISTVAAYSHVIGQPPVVMLPQLAVVIQQSASTNSTVNFSVTVNDPTNQGQPCTVTATWTGLTDLRDVATGLTLVSPFTINTGVAKNLLAIRNATFQGTGAATFHAVEDQRFDAWGTFWATDAPQNAEPTMTISIGTNNSVTDPTAKASAVVTGPSNAASIKWLASTIAQPSRASVIASGATVSAGAPTFAIADLGVSLNIGDTVFLTVVYYDSVPNAQTAGTGSAVRDTIQATKTVRWAASSLFSCIDPTFTFWTSVVAGAGTDQIIMVQSGVLPESGLFRGTVTLPDGCTITAASCEVSTANNGVVDAFATANGTIFVNMPQTTATGGYITNTATCSQSTTGKRITLEVDMGVLPGTADDARFRAFTLTYTTPNLQATV